MLEKTKGNQRRKPSRVPNYEAPIIKDEPKNELEKPSKEHGRGKHGWFVKTISMIPKTYIG